MAEYAKRGYLLENFRLFHLRSESGEKVDFHYHEFCKLLFLVSGQGSYFVDGKRYLLSAGDMVLIGSRSVHKPELAEGSIYERVIIYISPDYLQQMSSPDCDLLSLFSGNDDFHRYRVILFHLNYMIQNILIFFFCKNTCIESIIY